MARRDPGIPSARLGCRRPGRWGALALGSIAAERRQPEVASEPADASVVARPRSKASNPRAKRA